MKASGLILDSTQKSVSVTNMCGVQYGGTGGAFSMWLNIADCSEQGGIITTEENNEELQTGFNMFFMQEM